MPPKQKSNIKYSFIHIPKNAGTSMQNLIKTGQLPTFEYVGHHFRKRKVRNNTIRICVYRDPIQRFISAFYFSKRSHPDSPTHQKFRNPNQLIRAFRTPDHPKHKAARAFMGNSPQHNLKRFLREVKPHMVAGKVTANTWVFEPQTTWFNYLSPQNTIYLNFNQLSREYQILLSHIFPNPPSVSTPPSLPHKNSTASRQKFKPYQIKPKNKEFLQTYYQKDYANIQKIKAHYTLDKQLLHVLSNSDK